MNPIDKPAAGPIPWILSAAMSAYACHLAVIHSTPIDESLPFVAVLATVLAAVSYPAVMLAIPLLIVAEVALPDETARLMAFGAILSAACFLAVFAIPVRASSAREVRDSSIDGGRVPARRRKARRLTAVLSAIALIMLLRWIPFHGMKRTPEVLILLAAAGIVIALRGTALGVAIAVMAALMTPAIPMRTVALPFLVLGVVTLARVLGMPRIEWRWAPAAFVAAIVLFFPWSGVVARAMPYFLRTHPARERVVIARALPPGESLTLDVPANAGALILSGANVPRMRRGAVVGRIEPAGVPVKIGDVADWGYMRREYYYGSRNPLPESPAGKVRGYGYNAWVDGAGRIALPAGARTIRIVADGSLPRGASLQVEGFEIAAR